MPKNHIILSEYPQLRNIKRRINQKAHHKQLTYNGLYFSKYSPVKANLFAEHTTSFHALNSTTLAAKAASTVRKAIMRRYNKKVR